MIYQVQFDFQRKQIFEMEGFYLMGTDGVKAGIRMCLIRLKKLGMCTDKGNCGERRRKSVEKNEMIGKNTLELELG